MNNLIQYIKSFNSSDTSKSENRTKRININIIASFCLKFINTSVGYILLPLTLNFLTKDLYGLWLTIGSIISWFNVFDIGLSNGLRNKITEANTQKDLRKIKVYVSTTYAVLSIVAFIVLLLLLISINFINWQNVLNSKLLSNQEIKWVLSIVFVSFCLQLILKTITSVLLAYQLSAIRNSINTIVNILTLICVFLLVKFSKPLLLNYALTICSISFFTFLAFTIYLYKSKFNYIKPEIKNVDFSVTKELMPLSIRFFIIQLAGVIVFATDNFLINYFFSSASVVDYNIVYKYFNAITIIFHMLMFPLTSAYTEAFAIKDIAWIKGTYQKFLKIYFYLILLAIAMLLISNYAYSFWIGSEINISIIISSLMFIYIICNAWISLHDNFLNGVGKIKLATYIAVLACLTNIPLAFLFCKYFNLGIQGIIIANIISILPDVFLVKIQYNKIISNTAKGLWNE